LTGGDPLSHYSPILSFLCASRCDDQFVLFGAGGAGKLLTLGGAAFFGFIVLIMWCVALKLTSNTQQTGPKGDNGMAKLIGVSLATFVANASTALLVNNLPALSIRVI
jgi:hypothetical protein